jgi:hypothetical protein
MLISLKICIMGAVKATEVKLDILKGSFDLPLKSTSLLLLSNLRFFKPVQASKVLRTHHGKKLFIKQHVNFLLNLILPLVNCS